MLVEGMSDPGDIDLARALVAEANHRIANNLAVIAGLVRRQTAMLGDDAPLPAGSVRRILEDVQGRIDAVGRLHRFLSASHGGDGVDIGAYCEEIARSVVTNLSERGQVDFKATLDPTCRLSPDRALHLGLIVNELVTNAVKYAHPTKVAGAIELTVAHAGETTLLVEVTDDGVGLPDGGEPDAHHGGSEMVRRLTQRLGGTIHYDDDGVGLRVAVKVPTVA